MFQVRDGGGKDVVQLDVYLPLPVFKGNVFHLFRCFTILKISATMNNKTVQRAQLIDSFTAFISSCYWLIAFISSHQTEQGLCRRTLVQTVPSHQAPDRERTCGRQSEESQVHSERHGPVGRRRRVLRPGELDAHRRSHVETSINCTHCFEIAWCVVPGEQRSPTQSSCHGNRP